MELEFDKEIDAILRKARDGVAVASTAKAGHLDADAVAAFAENAVPPKAKLLYTEHFADCDGCRKLLSQAILLNNAADATAADPSFAATAVAAVTPWYVKLFRTPNLAMVMGALVLTFGVYLGYLALQSRNNGPTVASVADQDRSKGGPTAGIDAPPAAADSGAAANTAANASNTAAMPNGAANTTTTNSEAGRGPSSDTTGGTASGAASSSPSDTVVSADQPKTAAPAPPPAPAAEKPATGRDEKTADKAKEESKDAVASEQEADDRRARNGAPENAKKTGPNRASGPRQDTQNNAQNLSVAGMISATKTAGGKTFENLNGVWYDSAYNGQATTSVRRGTDAFNKLDGGLRSIANSISGTVVVMWKAKAYRIQ